MNNKIVELKHIVDDALAYGDTPIHSVICFKRTGKDVDMQSGRDTWWHDDMALASDKCETEVMDAEDPLFILYTSGSTGKPKALLHTHGGYAVYTLTTFRYVFDVQDDDVWWCAAESGLDHRPQLHRLFATHVWRNKRDLRRRPRISRA